jgi:hypothetical protein
MAAMDDSIETRLAHKRLFADFLNWEDADGWKLSEQLKDELADRDHKTNNVQRLIANRVDIQNYRLRNWNAAVQRQLLERPTEYLPGLQDAIGEYVASSDDFALASTGAGDGSTSATAAADIRVGLKGEFGELEVSPRDLGSSHLGKLVKVYGIVTKTSLVRPKLVRSVHYCPDTGVTSSREYRDITALTGLPTGAFVWRVGGGWCVCGRGPGGGVDLGGTYAAGAVHPHTHLRVLTPPTPSVACAPLPHAPNNRLCLPHARRRGPPAGHRVWQVPLPGQPGGGAAGAARDGAARTAALLRCVCCC